MPGSVFFHLTHPGIKILALWTEKAVLNLGQGSLPVDVQRDLFWVSAQWNLSWTWQELLASCFCFLRT